jgi:hypothetical protein
MVRSQHLSGKHPLEFSVRLFQPLLHLSKVLISYIVYVCEVKVLGRTSAEGHVTERNVHLALLHHKEFPVPNVFTAIKSL